MPDLYLYDEIWSGDAALYVSRIEAMKGRDIEIAVNSPGGDVFEAAAIYAAIARHDGQVTCRVDGIAASAASYVCMAASRVVMAPSAFMMIHLPWSIVMGNREDLEKMHRDLSQIESAMVKAYAAKSGKSDEEIRELLEKETLMTAETAVSEGFADEIAAAAADDAPKAKSKDEVQAVVAETDKKIVAKFSLAPDDQAALAKRNIAAAKAQAITVPVTLDISAVASAKTEPKASSVELSNSQDQTPRAGDEQPAESPPVVLQSAIERIYQMADLNELRAQRGAKIEAMAAIVGEPEKFKAANDELQAINDTIARIEQVERLKASVAKPVAGAVPAEPIKQVSKAQQFGQFVALHAKANGSLTEMRRIAAAKFGDRHPIVATLNTTDDAAVVPDPLANEIIELLRAESVVMSAAPRMVNLPNGKLTFPAGATGAAASYGAEAANIAATEPTFREVVLDAKKLAAIVPMSNEIVNDAQGDLEGWVRMDLVAAMAERADLAFLRGDGTSNTPTGFLNLVQGAASIAANATVNLANVTNDLGKLETVMWVNNVRPRRPVYFMSPRVFVYLSDLRDGNGNLAFPTLTSGDMPMLRRKPVYVSSQIPVNLGGGTNESEIYLVEMDHVMIGEVAGIEVSVSDEASYWNGSALQSAFSQDLTLIRAIHRHDIDIRQQFAVAVLTAVTWGA